MGQVQNKGCQLQQVWPIEEGQLKGKTLLWALSLLLGQKKACGVLEFSEAIYTSHLSQSMRIGLHVQPNTGIQTTLV